MKYAIELNNVGYTYEDGTEALQEINLKIEKGQIVTFMGENGSGKSTLFKILNGTLRPNKGTVLIDGKPIEYNKKELFQVRKKVGFIFQDSDDQLFSADVKQDISFGLFNLGYTNEIVAKKVKDIIEYFNMEEFSHKPVQFLSGGQKKRVAISDVVVMEPEIILMDEPASAMDSKNVEILDEIIENLNKKGITILISSHYSDRAFSNSHRILIMKNGKIIKDGKPEEVFLQKEILKEAHIKEPKVLKVYQLLLENNLIDKNEIDVPKNMEQLEKIIIEIGERK